MEALLLFTFLLGLRSAQLSFSSRVAGETVRPQSRLFIQGSDRSDNKAWWRKREPLSVKKKAKIPTVGGDRGA